MTFFSKLTNKNGPIYPWSQKKLNITNPFPRVGHSASQSARDNDIFIFGGIAKGKARNDVYLLDTSEYT